MSQKVLMALLILFAGYTVTAHADPRVNEARALIKEFASTLQGELKQAMQSGGPTEAIEVCHTRAPEIAAGLSSENGWEVARTSLKRRNADNAPDGWEREILQQFEVRKLAGEAPAELDYAETVTENGKPVFRYMKAIPTQKVCLACHGGDNVAPEVAGKIARYYPDDQARGYAEGDLRGAFTLRKVD